MKYMEILKSIREENNLSQDKLAKILEVSQKTISNWENGIDKPNFESMVLIYENFEITPNEFIGIDEMQANTKINRDVKELLNIFYNMNKANRQNLIIIGRALLAAEEQ